VLVLRGLKPRIAQLNVHNQEIALYLLLPIFGGSQPFSMHLWERQYTQSLEDDLFSRACRLKMGGEVCV